MSSMVEKLAGPDSRTNVLQDSARRTLKTLDNHYGKVIVEEEYVRVFQPMDGKVEIWRKVRKEKGDWLLEFTGTRYPISEET